MGTEDRNGDDLQFKRDSKAVAVCPICYCVFSEDILRTPRLLNCGHTFCHTCLQKLKKESLIECPYDRELTPVMQDKVSSLKKNFALISVCSGQEQTEVDNDIEGSTFVLCDTRYAERTADIESQDEDEGNCFHCKPSSDHQSRAIHAVGLMVLMGNLFFDWFVTDHVVNIVAMQERDKLRNHFVDKAVPTLKKLHCIGLDWYAIEVAFYVFCILTSVIFAVQFFGTMFKWCFADDKMVSQKLIVWVSLVFNDLPQTILTVVITYSTDDIYWPYIGSTTLGVVGNYMVFYALGYVKTFHYPKAILAHAILVIICFVIQIAHITKVHLV